ncbi:Hypothetical protein FKW44_002576, partial [Caligus rogercresseyi]
SLKSLNLANTPWKFIEQSRRSVTTTIRSSNFRPEDEDNLDTIVEEDGHFPSSSSSHPVSVDEGRCLEEDSDKLQEVIRASAMAYNTSSPPRKVYYKYI